MCAICICTIYWFDLFSGRGKLLAGKYLCVYAMKQNMQFRMEGILLLFEFRTSMYVVCRRCASWFYWYNQLCRILPSYNTCPQLWCNVRGAEHTPSTSFPHCHCDWYKYAFGHNQYYSTIFLWVCASFVLCREMHSAYIPSVLPNMHDFLLV